MIKIGIVIINWNGIEDTIDCIRSLLCNSYKEITIFLIDNNSAHNEGARLSNLFGDTIIFIQSDTNTGFSGGCNLGIHKALSLGFQYIMLFNNDAIARNGFIEKLVSDIQLDQSIGVIGPAITYYHQPNILWFAGGDTNLIIGAAIHKYKGKGVDILRLKSTYDTGYVSGCCMLIRKEVFERIGFFDEDYFAYNEEVDFCFRARNTGFRCVINPESIVEHKKGASTGKAGSKSFSKIQAYLIARNGVLFGKKNFSGLQKYWYLFTQFSILPILRLLFQLRSFNSIKYYFFGLSNNNSIINVIKNK